MSDIVEYISNYNTYVINIRKNIHNEIKSILEASIDKSDTLIRSVEEWLQTIDLAGECVFLQLPSYLESEEQKIMSKISKTHTGEISISFHEGKHVNIFCGSHIAQFNPPEFIQKATEIISEKYNFITSDLQNLSVKTIENIIAECNRLLDK